MVQFVVEHKGASGQVFVLGNDGIPELQEWTSYVIEGTNLEGIPGFVSILKTDDLGSGTLAEINFGNYVGIASILGKQFRVKSKKISAEVFNQMLAEVSEEISNLPFDFNTPTFSPFERTTADNPDTIYQQFSYLRYIVLFREPKLLDEFNAIECNPHRLTLRVDWEDDLERVRRVSPATILRSLTKTENMTKIGPNSPAYYYPVSVELMDDSEARAIPTSLRDERMESSFDTPENRFIKDFLQNSRRLVETLLELTRPKQQNCISSSSDLLADAERVAKVLDRMLSSRILSEVMDLQRMPVSSQVLHKSDGYREFFGHYHRMALSSTFPLSDEAEKQIIENKDVATLFEYWCFFTIARILENSLGKPTSAAIHKTDPFATELKNGISLDYGGKAVLWFNKTYQGNSSCSYSVTLRPDISLKIGGRLHLFDAKFKYDQHNLPFLDDSLAGSEETIEKLESQEELRQVFKQGDLYKMHTYKDAIVEARDVWILYPGTEFRFYEEGHGRVSSPDLIKAFMGVGAIPIKPMSDLSILNDILANMIDQTTLAVH